MILITNPIPFSFFYCEEKYTRLLTCDNGISTTTVNQTDTYTAKDRSNMISPHTTQWIIYDHKGEDAIGTTAILNLKSEFEAEITFTKVGIYEIYLEVSGLEETFEIEYWFEAIVEAE